MCRYRYGIEPTHWTEFPAATVCVAQVVSLSDFSTTLAGQTAAVTFQLPELQVQSVFTTAVVPDGGSILIGGLSRLRNIERRAEVPFLAKIPLLGFFFMPYTALAYMAANSTTTAP